MKKRWAIFWCFLFVLSIGLGTGLADTPGFDPGFIDHGTLGVFDMDEVTEGVQNDAVVNILQVTTNPGSDLVQCWGADPWSPDGLWITYTAYLDSGEESKNEICKMKANGTGWVQLTGKENDESGSDCDTHASFTPDGSKIVLQREIESYAEIWIMNADGSNQTSLSKAHQGEVTSPYFNGDGENKPRVSPDGTKIAFHSCYGTDSGGAIWVMDIDGTNVVKVSDDLEECSKHSWSPDSQWILFDSNIDDYSKIFKVRPDGTSLRMLSDRESNVCENWAFWSPDGNWITYHTGNDPLTINIMRPDGSEKEVLVDEDDLEMDDVCGPKSWSPDSKWIAFKRDTDDGINIYVINIDTREIIQLTEGYDDKRHWWSPDGKRILFRDYGGTTRDDNDYGNDLLTINMAPQFWMGVDGADRATLGDGETLENGDLAMSVTVVGGFCDVMIARYSGNPMGIGFNGSFWDLLVPNPGTVSTITLKLFFTGSPSDRDLTPFWFNETNNTWVAVSNYGIKREAVTVGGINYTGWVEITITAATSPNLNQLTGLVVAVGSPAATGVGASGGSSGGCFIDTLAPGAFPVSIAGAVVSLLGFVFTGFAVFRGGFKK